MLLGFEGIMFLSCTKNVALDINKLQVSCSLFSGMTRRRGSYVGPATVFIFRNYYWKLSEI